MPDWREREATFFRTCARPIETENNVWIGGCILLPGVTIGENSVTGKEDGTPSRVHELRHPHVKPATKNMKTTIANI